MGCAATSGDNIHYANSTVLSLNKIYERKELIGCGSFGKVYRCINKIDNQEYALKVVEITAKDRDEAVKQINNLKSEISVLKKLHHPHIIKYYSFDIAADNKHVEIVLEYAK
jgi:serine/threonine protein kinase